jgi:hypothetical protein
MRPRRDLAARILTVLIVLAACVFFAVVFIWLIAE